MVEGIKVEAVVHVAGDSAMAIESDASLVRAVVEGSEQALAGIYDRHGNAVFAAAMRVS